MQNLTIGQRVGYCRFHNGTPLFYGFANVTKINGHGHIHLDNGKIFDKWGKERCEFAQHNLIQAERLENILKFKHEQKQHLSAANKILKLIRENMSDADCVLKAETKKELCDLINSL